MIKSQDYYAMEQTKKHLSLIKEIKRDKQLKQEEENEKS